MRAVMDHVALHRPDGAVAVPHVEVARTPLERMRGLLGRRTLGAGCGMLFPGAGAVHTFAMRFAIDLVFLDRQQRVVRVIRALPPWRMARGGSGAAATLELPAGAAAAHQIEVGGVLIARPAGTGR